MRSDWLIARDGPVGTVTLHPRQKVCVIKFPINTRGILTSDGHTIGYRYEVYDQTLTPEIDGRSHLNIWKDFLENVLLRRKLLPEEHIFPCLSSNGTVYTDEAMDQTAVQRLIDEFSQKAEVNRHYTTHSFRRGGAQYRFMYAPLGERWSLSVVRWWGGWADGEHVRQVCLQK